MALFPAGAVTESLLCSSLLENSLDSHCLKEARSLDKGRGVSHSESGRILFQGVPSFFYAPSGSLMVPPTSL